MNPQPPVTNTFMFFMSSKLVRFRTGFLMNDPSSLPRVVSRCNDDGEGFRVEGSFMDSVDEPEGLAVARSVAASDLSHQFVHEGRESVVRHDAALHAPAGVEHGGVIPPPEVRADLLE